MKKYTTKSIATKLRRSNQTAKSVKYIIDRAHAPLQRKTHTPKPAVSRPRPVTPPREPKRVRRPAPVNRDEKHPKKLFLGRLQNVYPWESQIQADLRKEMLERAFYKYGNLVYGCLGRVRVTVLKGKNFAFVEVWDKDKAELAIKEMRVHYPVIDRAHSRRRPRSAVV